MRSDTLTLGFDTSAAHCAAALLSGDEILHSVAEPMTRGQAERLMPMIEALLRDHGRTWQDIGRIGVGTGPGNFTGIRIAVSAARGLALGLGIPALGVSGFDVIAHAHPAMPAAIPAPRGLVYWRADGAEPALCAPPVDVAAANLPDPARHAETIARLAATAAQGARPAPIYLKPADAAPASDPPPRILDDA